MDGTTAATIPIRDTNGRMQAADPASGATDKTLVTANWVSQTGSGAPNNLLHKSGDEKFTGSKTGLGTAFAPLICISSTTMERDVTPSSTIVGPNFAFRDKNDITIAGIYFQKDTTGKYSVVVRILNSDNSTWKYVTLATSN